MTNHEFLYIRPLQAACAIERAYCKSILFQEKVRAVRQHLYDEKDASYPEGQAYKPAFWSSFAIIITPIAINAAHNVRYRRAVSFLGLKITPSFICDIALFSVVSI